MKSKLAGHTALVTGGSRGIGRAIALALAECGADVAVNYKQNAAAAEETVCEIQELGCRAVALQADVTDLDAVNTMVTDARKELAPPDILVNNAGVLFEKPLSFMSDEEWDTVVDPSLKGAFHCIKATVRDMTRARQGRIINISSVAGLTGDPMRSGYAAAKAGMIGLTKAMARELAGAGITVNAVAPGIIETDMTSDTPEDKKKKQLALIPLRRFGTPRDVAELVAFLAGNGAAYITGQILSVDGGLRM